MFEALTTNGLLRGICSCMTRAANEPRNRAQVRRSTDHAAQLAEEYRRRTGAYPAIFDPRPPNEREAERLRRRADRNEISREVAETKIAHLLNAQ